MIYSDTFVWLHFPKCAGTKIERLFEYYYKNNPEIHQDLIGVKNNPTISWHDTLHLRAARDPEFQLGNRTVICSFRRLPSWLESRYNYEYKRNPQLDHRPELLLEGRFVEQNGVENHADSYAMAYLTDELLASGKLRFLRAENFADDFKSVFGDYLDVSMIPNSELNKKVNSSTSNLPLHVKQQLYDNQQTLYEMCPYWRKIEAIAYGTT